MEWTNVKTQLPPDGRYLCIIKYFETVGGPTLSMTSPKHLVIECYFDPQKGWEVPPIAKDVKVLFWMPAIGVPDDLGKC